MMVDVPIVWESDENDTPQDVAAFLRASNHVEPQRQQVSAGQANKLVLTRQRRQ